MPFRRDYERSTQILTRAIRLGHTGAIVSHVFGASARIQEARPTLMHGVGILLRAYEGRKRKVGGPAVIHPLRVARRVRLWGVRSPTRLLVALGHDLIEDLDQSFPRLKGLDDARSRRVQELMARLTRGEHEAYFDYIGRLAQDDDALLIKLADRLDNTLDLRVDSGPEHAEPGSMYQVLFRRAVMDDLAPIPRGIHPDRAPIDTSHRLYDLFKSLVLLHFVRRREVPHRVSQAARRLASAARAEAELTALHILTYHHTPGMAREAMSAVSTYGDRFWRVTASGESPLDGLMELFDARMSKRDRAVLERLQDDTRRMLMAALSLVVILVRFAEDDQFEGIAGVGKRGVEVVGRNSC